MFVGVHRLNRNQQWPWQLQLRWKGWGQLVTSPLRLGPRAGVLGGEKVWSSPSLEMHYSYTPHRIGYYPEPL